MGRTLKESVKIQQRRQMVAELYLQSIKQSDIARQLSVSQSTVSLHIKMIRKEWRESALRDFDEAIGMELGKLKLIEREAWRGWQRSCEPSESTKVTSDGSGKKAEKVTKDQPGDPRFLEQIHRCISARRALLGLDAPTRIAPTSPDGQESYHAAVMKELMRLAEEAKDGPLVIDAEVIEQQVQEAAKQPALLTHDAEEQERNS